MDQNENLIMNSKTLENIEVFDTKSKFRSKIETIRKI